MKIENAEADQKDKLIDDLGSIFDSSEKLEPPKNETLTKEGEKIKEDLDKARQLLDSGMNQVR